MEVDIYCNVVKCRKPLALEKQACVTSCSHIFCVQCSNSVFAKALLCPACDTSLTGNEDIVLTELNPTEEYKSSVLAGLSPEVILDISSRAIAFYEYQQSQEILYRTMLQKNTQQKYTTLKHKYNMTTRDLNQIIKAEKDKQIALLKDFDQEKAKSKQIHTKLEEKNKQFQKLQTMYEKLKRKTTAISNIHSEQPQKGTSTHRESNTASSTSMLFHNSHQIQFKPTHPMSTNNQQQNQVIRLNDNAAIDEVNYPTGGIVDGSTANNHSTAGGDGAKTVFAQAINHAPSTNISLTSPSRIPSPVPPMYAVQPRNHNAVSTAALTTARYDRMGASGGHCRPHSGELGSGVANYGYYLHSAPPPIYQQPPVAAAQRHARRINGHYQHQYRRPLSRAASPRSRYKTHT